MNFSKLIAFGEFSKSIEFDLMWIDVSLLVCENTEADFYALARSPNEIR